MHIRFEKQAVGFVQIPVILIIRAMGVMFGLNWSDQALQSGTYRSRDDSYKVIFDICAYALFSKYWFIWEGEGIKMLFFSILFENYARYAKFCPADHSYM